MEWNFDPVAGPFEGLVDGPLWDGEGLVFCLVDESRILRYDPEGRLAGGFTIDGLEDPLAWFHNDLRLDREGRLYVTDYSKSRILVFRQDGTPAGEIKAVAHASWEVLRRSTGASRDPDHAVAILAVGTMVIPSMAAADASPNRVTRARYAAMDLLAAAHGFVVRGGAD